MVEAIQTILKKAHAAGIKACLHCGSSAYAAKAIGWGFDLVTILNDVRLLAVPPPRPMSTPHASCWGSAGHKPGSEEHRLLTWRTSSSPTSPPGGDLMNSMPRQGSPYKLVDEISLASYAPYWARPMPCCSAPSR